jgi:hypothetical protein
LLVIPNNSNNSYKSIIAGENEYTIDIPADNKYNWHRLSFNFAYTGSAIGISNLKLKFLDSNIYSIRQAIDNGYIEPLVVVSEGLRSSGTLFLPTPFDIVNTNGNTGTGSNPILYINLKPKNSQLVSIILTSTKASASTDGLLIQELRNFDMSITPTN